MFTLNCFVCEISRMILKKVFFICFGFRWLDFLVSWSVNRAISNAISSTNDANNQHNPQKKNIGSAPMIDKLNETSDSMSKATKYPIGFFQLNGNLVDDKMTCIVLKRSFSPFESVYTCTYAVGNGKMYAPSPHLQHT